MRRQFERPSFQVAGEGAPLRDPFTAAALSVVPGLGQLYNGDSTKGFLFIDVAFVNFLVLCLILFRRLSKCLVRFLHFLPFLK